LLQHPELRPLPQPLHQSVQSNSAFQSQQVVWHMANLASETGMLKAFLPRAAEDSLSDLQLRRRDPIHGMLQPVPLIPRRSIPPCLVRRRPHAKDADFSCGYIFYFTTVPRPSAIVRRSRKPYHRTHLCRASRQRLYLYPRPSALRSEEAARTRASTRQADGRVPPCLERVPHADGGPNSASPEQAERQKQIAAIEPPRRSRRQSNQDCAGGPPSLRSLLPRTPSLLPPTPRLKRPNPDRQNHRGACRCDIGELNMMPPSTGFQRAGPRCLRCLTLFHTLPIQNTQ